MYRLLKIGFFFFFLWHFVTVAKSTDSIKNDFQENPLLFKKTPKDWNKLKIIISKTKYINFESRTVITETEIINQEMKSWVEEIDSKLKIGSYTNFNLNFQELYGDITGFINDLKNPEESKDIYEIMRCKFIDVWDKKFALKKTSFKEYFLNEFFAKSYAQNKINYYLKKDDHNKVESWEKKLKEISVYALPNLKYTQDEIMGIEFIKSKKSDFNKYPKIAVIEITGNSLHTKNVLSVLQNKPISVNERTGIFLEVEPIVQNLKLPLSIFSYSLSIKLDKRDVFLEKNFGIKENQSTNFILYRDESSQSILFKAYLENCIEINYPYLHNEDKNEDITLLDYFLREKIGNIVDCTFQGDADEEISKVFDDITKKEIKIVNISNSIPIGPKSVKSIKCFIKQDGVIIKAVLNEGTKWDKNGFPFSNISFSTILDLFKFLPDLTLYLILLKQEFSDIRSGFIMVGSLSKSLLSIEKNCDKPGSNFNDIYIGAWGERVPIRLEDDMYYALKSGSSVAAPTVTGAIALITYIAPQYSLQKIIKSILSNSYKDDSDYKEEERGQGRLNAKAAFESFL